MNLKYIKLMIISLCVANTFESLSSQKKETASLLAATKKIQEIIADYAAEWRFYRQPSHLSENIEIKFFENYGIFRTTNDCVVSVAFSPDGKFLAAGLGNSLIKIFDIDNRKCIKELEHTDSKMLKLKNPHLQSVKYSQNNDLLASAVNTEDKGYIFLWSLKENAILFQAIDLTIISMSYSPNGKYISYNTVLSTNETVIDLESRPRKCFSLIPDQNSLINMVTFSKNYLASCNKGGDLKVWKIQNDEFICEKSFSLKGKEQENLLCLDISPCERFIALCGEINKQGSLKVINLDTGLITRFPSALPLVNIKFSKDSKHVYACDYHNLKIWDIRTGDCIQTYSKLRNSDLQFELDNLAISPDGTRLAIGQYNGIINIFINTRNRLLRSSDLSKIFGIYKPCDFCLKSDSQFRCACREVYYCSRDCQKKDYSNHKISCTYKKTN